MVAEIQCVSSCCGSGRLWYPDSLLNCACNSGSTRRSTSPTSSGRTHTGVQWPCRGAAQPHRAACQWTDIPLLRMAMATAATQRRRTAQRPVQPKQPRGSRETSSRERFHLRTNLDAMLYNHSADKNGRGMSRPRMNPSHCTFSERAALISVDDMSVENRNSASRT